MLGDQVTPENGHSGEINAQTNKSQKVDSLDAAIAEMLGDQVTPENGHSREIEESLALYREYVTTMHGEGKASREHRKYYWENKYKGKSLFLPAVMKKVKKDKVDCVIEGHGVIIEMRHDQINRAVSIRKGEKFLVRGTISDRRLGILHVLGLSDGEIISKPSDSN